MVEVPPVRATDAELVRTSFAALADDTESVARLFYATLFAIDPPTRDLFPVTMTAQRERFVAALAHVLGRVDDPDRLVPFLAQLGRDHRKFGVLTEHYASVGAALVTSVRRHAGDRWDDDLEQAWTEAFRTVAETMSTAARTERGPATWAATVVGHRRLGDDLAVVRLLSDTPVPRAAGQYVSVQVPQRPRMWRWMSPASAPNGTGELELHVRAVPGGWVSGSIVAHTRVGDRWLVGPALGRMSVDRAGGRDVLMVAGGTGLAPLRAIVEQMATRGANPRVQLFVGGRTRADLYDLDALQRTATTNPWLTVVPVLEESVGRHGAPEERPDGMHTVLRGTLAEVVAGLGDWADRQVLLSGSPGMVRATLAAMTAAGTPPHQISWDPLPPA
ncbi:globin domain-containing protein [Rhodococcus antarcticus]|uniref:nitric oxide dioxygenase n=1 Tax=Rhodococcus antarcticus TaxID=2987751 RepID=A0ABY6P033_9NOCA|nr:globin domain-containing protein [Rhodococcus antarcticus]UZJ25017.1 globin domain-containing protein [Rhodococcus antarcticus]